MKLRQRKVVKRLIEAYEMAETTADARAMADIALQIDSMQKDKE